MKILRKYKMDKFQIVLNDRSILDSAGLCHYLYGCYINNVDCVIDSHLEAYDLRITNVYDVIDQFVERTGYDANRITIINGNMIDAPHNYKLIKRPEYWYEIYKINNWLDENHIQTTYTPMTHFGCFLGRSTWYRIWLGAYLWNNYRETTIQTFHSSLHCNYVIPSDDGIVDLIGLDDLDYFNCDYWQEILEFLSNTPLNVDDADLEKIRKERNFIKANNNGCYPIQHPSNLNVLQYYNDFFVDIVCETRVSGDVFFVSEKTIRAIVGKRPFILMGNREVLHNLRKLGFCTFDRWWNESYDGYGERDRLKLIINLIDELSSWSLQKLESTLIEMQETLDHNYRTFRNLTPETVREVFDV